jgi:hypothetical protein
LFRILNTSVFVSFTVIETTFNTLFRVIHLRVSVKDTNTLVFNILNNASVVTIPITSKLFQMNNVT